MLKGRQARRMESLSFDFDENPPQENPAPEAPRTWTVTALTAEIHRLLSRQFDDIRVSGEISGYKVWNSGHAYFTLKDEGAQLRCVMFRGPLRYLKFKPADGLAVIARGSVEVRQERGEYQLIVSSLDPQGYGALQLAFEQLKRKLAGEGLFDPERKRPLPPYPRRVGIVTSPKGAVIRDMLNVLGRRWPGLHIRLYPTQVQGDGAIEGVCAGLNYFSRSGWPDVVIVGRGGGSLEDLWTFNEEAVARAIAACSVPVVSAVGHETDFTIADFVADLRAPTPSAAAELIVRDLAEVLRGVDTAEARAARAVRYVIAAASKRLTEHGVDRAAALLSRRIGRAMQRVDDAEQTIASCLRAAIASRIRQWRAADAALRANDVRVRLESARGRLDNSTVRLHDSARRRLAAALHTLAPLEARLHSLSPLGVLERGYAVVETDGRAIVRDPAAVSPGQHLNIRLAKGRLGATADPTPPPSP
jgi:exodeoxyribonuclease VII large subunit